MQTVGRMVHGSRERRLRSGVTFRANRVEVAVRDRNPLASRRAHILPVMIHLKLTDCEGAALSAACLFARNAKNPHPNVESARGKIREALDHPAPDRLDEGERYVALEC